MDYDQGLNPIGKCYMTGIGFDRVHNPQKRESAYAEAHNGMGWAQPGITVYGPLEPSKLSSSPGSVQIPPLSGLPRERRYVDHLGYWAMDEFTVYQSEVFPAAIYPVLAQGGKWNPAKEPFLNPAASINVVSNGWTLTFGGLPGQTNFVQVASTVTGPWSDLSGPLLPDASGTVQFTHYAGPGGRGSTAPGGRRRFISPRRRQFNHKSPCLPQNEEWQCLSQNEKASLKTPIRSYRRRRGGAALVCSSLGAGRASAEQQD